VRFNQRKELSTEKANGGERYALYPETHSKVQSILCEFESGDFNLAFEAN
jgi:hypothetical protein